MLVTANFDGAKAVPLPVAEDAPVESWEGGGHHQKYGAAENVALAEARAAIAAAAAGLADFLADDLAGCGDDGGSTAALLSEGGPASHGGGGQSTGEETAIGAPLPAAPALISPPAVRPARERRPTARLVGEVAPASPSPARPAQASMTAARARSGKRKGPASPAAAVAAAAPAPDARCPPPCSPWPRHPPCPPTPPTPPAASIPAAAAAAAATTPHTPGLSVVDARRLKKRETNRLSARRMRALRRGEWAGLWAQVEGLRNENARLRAALGLDPLPPAPPPPAAPMSGSPTRGCGGGGGGGGSGASGPANAARSSPSAASQAPMLLVDAAPHHDRHRLAPTTTAAAEEGLHLVFGCVPADILAEALAM